MLQGARELMPLLRHQTRSGWHQEVHAIVQAERTEDARVLRNNTIRILAGSAIAGVSLAGALLLVRYARHIPEAFFWGGAVLFAGTVGGVLFTAVSSFNACKYQKKSSRAICLIVQDETKSKELSRDLCSQEYGRLYETLQRKYPGVTLEDLVTFKYVSKNSAKTMKSLEPLFATTMTKVFGTFRQDALGFIQQKWLSLRNLVRQEVPHNPIDAV